MKAMIENKVRKFAQNYLNACDWEQKEESVDMLSAYISDSYELFEFTDEEIEFIEEENLFSFIRDIMDEEVKNFMNEKFWYNEECLTGSYVGIDHIICDEEDYYDFDELQYRCDEDKIYLFQLHNNSDLPPLVLFAIFDKESVDEAINCLKENDCVSYNEGQFDDVFLNSFLNN